MALGMGHRADTWQAVYPSSDSPSVVPWPHLAWPGSMLRRTVGSSGTVTMGSRLWVQWAVGTQTDRGERERERAVEVRFVANVGE